MNSSKPDFVLNDFQIIVIKFRLKERDRKIQNINYFYHVFILSFKKSYQIRPVKKTTLHCLVIIRLQLKYAACK